MADGSTTDVTSIQDNRAPSPEPEKRDGDPEIPSNNDSHIEEAPNGGAAAWLVVLGTWCTSFCSFEWINSVGLFQDYYQREMLKHYSSSTIAWIPSLQIFFMMASVVVMGRLYDRYGPRHLLMAGTLFHVFGLMMAALSTKYYRILLSQGICSAIGASALFQPSISAVRGWFDKKRGAAFGIASTGSSFLGPSSAGFLGDKFGRFNVFTIVWCITGVLTLGLWIPANNNAALICFAAFFGYFSGAYISLSPALVAEISPPQEFEYRTGLLFAFGSIGGLITNPIAGAIMELNHGSFTGLKVFARVFGLVGTVITFAARLSKTGFKISVKF
ncbi:Fc.00g079100.m01.CDS01 [Cosmosporella sp. VM-42]